MHCLQRNNVRRWVALSEGAGGTVGWLTVSIKTHGHFMTLYSDNRMFLLF